MVQDSSCSLFTLIEYSSEFLATLEANHHVLARFVLGRIACFERDNIHASPKEPLDFLAQQDVLSAKSMHLMGVKTIILQHLEDPPCVLPSTRPITRVDDDGVAFPLVVHCHQVRLRFLKEPLSIHFHLLAQRINFA